MMVLLWIVLAFLTGASFGCMCTAGIMLALAVNKEADVKAQTLIETGPAL